MSIAEMERERDRLYREYVDSIGTQDEKRLLKALDLMDEILDEQIAVAQDDILEESDEGDHWDEWMLDNTIDRMREEMAYEV